MTDELKRRLEHQLYLAKEDPEPVYDVSNCGLLMVPQGCFSLCKVLRKKKLCLNNNMIKVLNSNGNKVEDLIVLTELYLQFNDIIRLPDEIGRIDYLQILNISNNKLTSLTPFIGDLKYLRELYLQDNSINVLPKSLFKANSNLEVIDISENPTFGSIPIDIIKLDKLRKFTCTTKYLQTPSQEICDQGLVEIIKYLCKDKNIEIHESFLERMSNCENRNTSLVDSSVLDYEQYKQNQLNLLQSIETKYQQIVCSQKSFSDKLWQDRTASIQKLAQDEASITSKIAMMQKDRDRHRLQLIEDIKAAENDAASFIAEIMAANKACQIQEKILDEIENENLKKYQLYHISKEEVNQLQRMKILNAMSQMLNYKDNFKGYRKNSLPIPSNETELSKIMDGKMAKQAEIVSQIENEENKQKLAFQYLQLQKDIRTLRLTEYIYSIESELILLSQAEQRKRAQNNDFKYNALNERRQQLVEMLETLIKRKKLREQVLYQRMVAMEEQRQHDQTDFWLIHYQRCLDIKPHCFWNMSELSHKSEKEEIQFRESHATYSRETECCICLNEETSVLFVPCGHICCCEKCIQNIKQCPICRTEITRIIKLTYSSN